MRAVIPNFEDFDPSALISPVNPGLIVDYLRRHIGPHPGAEFQGYAKTFLGAPDGLVRRSTSPLAKINLHESANLGQFSPPT
jgi:hypothetical protein